MKKIVLTGGPGAGKTTSLEYLKSKLECHGYGVLVAPELATMMFNSGVDLRTKNTAQLLTLQKEMIQCQMRIENALETIATSLEDKEHVIICDRGAMDPKAFMPHDSWYRMIDMAGMSESALRDLRYDAIIHLTTPSDDFYRTDNNPARQESGSQARDLDVKIQNAWIGHPHLRVIDSCSDFKEKMRKALDAVYRVVGIPEPLEIERKYLVSHYDSHIPVKNIDALIEQVYLKDGSRIRARTQGSVTIYTHTNKTTINDTTRTEIENKISEGTYRSLMEERDTACRIIKKIRRSFLWHNQYFELDIFIEPHKHLAMLEIELEKEDQEVILPPFVTIDREVTGEKRFTNSFLARE